MGSMIKRDGELAMLRDNAEEQQCLVVLLHAVAFDFTHDQFPELREWLPSVVHQQRLESIETKFFIARVGYFRDPIGHHQKQILRRIGDAMARLASPRDQAQGKLRHREPHDRRPFLLNTLNSAQS
jgi:hypothetical protein